MSSINNNINSQIEYEKSLDRSLALWQNGEWAKVQSLRDGALSDPNTDNALNYALLQLTKCISLLNTVALSNADAIQKNAQILDNLNRKSGDLQYETYTKVSGETNNLTDAEKAENALNPINWIMADSALIARIFGSKSLWDRMESFFGGTHFEIDETLLHEIQSHNTANQGVSDQLNISSNTLRQDASVKTAQASTNASLSTQVMQTAANFMDLMKALVRTICRT